MAWPKLPADAHSTWRAASGAVAARYELPLPLKDRMGLQNSTLSQHSTPSAADSSGDMNCGESVNAGSIRLRACLIAVAVTGSSTRHMLRMTGYLSRPMATRPAVRAERVVISRR